MLPDNCRALSLTKKMGFMHEYLSDGTVKGSLNLKDELSSMECPSPKNFPSAAQEKKQEGQSEAATSRPEKVQQ
jgi:hypothetical protein